MEDLWKKLKPDQFQDFLDQRRRLMEMPGVRLVVPELVDLGTRELAIFVYLDADHRSTLDSLPGQVAGVPLAVKLEDPKSGHLWEVVHLAQRDARDKSL